MEQTVCAVLMLQTIIAVMTYAGQITLCASCCDPNLAPMLYDSMAGICCCQHNAHLTMLNGA